MIASQSRYAGFECHLVMYDGTRLCAIPLLKACQRLYSVKCDEHRTEAQSKMKGEKIMQKKIV